MAESGCARKRSWVVGGEVGQEDLSNIDVLLPVCVWVSLWCGQVAEPEVQSSGTGAGYLVLAFLWWGLATCYPLCSLSSPEMQGHYSSFLRDFCRMLAWCLAYNVSSGRKNGQNLRDGCLIVGLREGECAVVSGDSCSP